MMPARDQHLHPVDDTAAILLTSRRPLEMAKALWQDGYLRFAAVVLLLFELPYLVPWFTDAQLDLLASSYTNPYLLPVVIGACLAGWSTLESRAERELWACLAAALYFWWCFTLISLALPAHFRGSTFRLITDGLYGLYYVGFLVAAALAAYRSIDEPAKRWVHCLRAIGVVVMAGSLVMYLLIVPFRVQDDFTVSWVPSLILYVGLDLLLAGSFGWLTISARGKWRWICGLLAVTALLMAALDSVEALMYQGVLDGSNPRTNFLWNLPFIPLVAAARLRHLWWPEKPALEPAEARPLDAGSPLVVGVFLLPMMHFGGHQLDVFEASLRGARDGVFLFCFLLVATLALAENLLVQRLARRAVRTRRELTELRIANQVAERAEQDRIQFLANVSHEIRTPMNGILGMTWLLRQGDISEAAQRYSQVLETSARSLLRLFDEFLDYSRLETGRLEIKPTPTDVGQLATDVIELFQPAADDKAIELSLSLADNLSSPQLVDASRLRQVLVNLVSNALKFTPDRGRVELAVDQPASDLRLSVSDTGIGIQRAAQIDLFTPFNRGDLTSEERFDGTGLGLAISKRIALAMGGDIELASQPGDGSTFILRLPSQPCAPSDLSVESLVRVSQRGPGNTSNLAQELRILLVEDNEVNQLVTSHQLASLGLSPTIVNNGRDALIAVGREDFDLILMDCQMPEMDGYETTRRLRRRERPGVHVPIIAATAHAFEADRNRCLGAGMDDFLTKPFDDQQLARMLGRWLPSLPPFTPPFDVKR